MMDKTCITSSPEETKLLGKEIAKFLVPGSVVALFGDLGAGKTTLIKGIALGLGVEEKHVTSPTFNYLHIYNGSKELYHFDLYRVEDDKQFFDMGFDEYLFQQGISLLEWPEKVLAHLPSSTISISLSHEAEEKRKIVFSRLKLS